MILALAMMAGSGQAQTGAPNQKEIIRSNRSETVIVTATRYKETLATVPAHVTVISELDIANSTAGNIPELLRTAVGVHVADITGNRRSYRVDLRGFGEAAQSNTLVMVDGRPVNQADLSGTDWLQLPLDHVSRIEIIRGGRGSVLYGDNAGAGVINIITKQAEALEAGADFVAGSYKTVKGGGYLRGLSDDTSYGVAGSAFHTDGYRDNGQSRGGDISGRFAFGLRDRFNLAVTGGLHTDQTGLPGALKESELEAVGRRGTTHPDDFADTGDYYVLLQPQMTFRDESHLRADISLRKRNSLFFSSFFGGTFEGKSDISTFTFSPQLVFKNRMRSTLSNFTVGMDVFDSKEDILNTTVLESGNLRGAFDLEKSNYGFYLHEEFYPVETLAISGGYRYDHSTFTFSPSTPRQTSYEKNLATAGINYNPTRELYIYLSYSRSFRNPVLDELFDFFTNTINTNLKPQTSDNFEVGLRHYFTESTFGNVNIFLLDSVDEIFFNPRGGPFGFGANENLDGKSRRRGLELSLAGNIRNLAVAGSYSYIDADIRSGQYTGSLIPSVPKHKATVDCTAYLRRGFKAGLNGSYVGARLFAGDFLADFGDQDAHFLLNAHIRHDGRHLSVFMDLNNLLNQDYSEYAAIGGFPVERAFYPSPKFNFRLGIAIKY
jgi:iron complex outermembrane receptor protein